MSVAQIWTNIVAYALQIGLLVGLGALAPPVLRLRTPAARLLYWQMLLLACLVLPWVQPWRQEVISLANADTQSASRPTVAETAAPVAHAPVSGSVHRAIPFTSIVLLLLAAGVAIRLMRLGIGLARLAGYRRRGREMVSDPVFRIATAVSARWLVSDEIPGPVTFGWRDPVVLLPARFASLRAELREAILCHELIHVERRDWMFTFAEELVRAVLWFHPAVWWVLAEIQLAREQTVDRAVVEITHAREPYVDALLAMAGAPDDVPGSLDLAPAPLFLRKRHLKQRVIGLLQEARMLPLSKVRLILTHAGAMAAIIGACWLASGTFPLSAAPQFVTDAEGVMVDAGDAKLVYRAPVAYPEEALEKGVQGKVVIQASVDFDGEVGEKTVVNCPRELCDAAVDSLPQWRFDRRQANTTHEISIDFVKPAWAPATQEKDDPETNADLARVLAAQSRKTPLLLAQAATPVASGPMVSPAQAHSLPALPTFTANTIWMDGQYVILASRTSPGILGQKLKEVRISGLSDSDSSQLTSRLPVHAGDVWTAAAASIVSQVVTGFNPQLEVEIVNYLQPREFGLWIGLPQTASGKSVIVPPPLPQGVYAAGNGVAPPAVLSKVDPAYTDGARSVGISGTVVLSLVVGANGLPQSIEVIGSLDPGLDQSAMDALGKWRFRPGMKDGAPVNVQALVNLSFRVL